MAKKKKWFPCLSARHLWPQSLQEQARLCCSGAVAEVGETPLAAPPAYICSAGRHVWACEEKASLCCDGYVPVKKTIGKPGSKNNRFEMRERVLVPVSEITDMDETSSNPEALIHLYKPM